MNIGDKVRVIVGNIDKPYLIIIPTEATLDTIKQATIII